MSELLVGFSGSWPKVFHHIRPDSEYSACSNFIHLHFFHKIRDMPKVNEEWAIWPPLRPCKSCWPRGCKEFPAQKAQEEG